MKSAKERRIPADTAVYLDWAKSRSGIVIRDSDIQAGCFQIRRGDPEYRSAAVSLAVNEELRRFVSCFVQAGKSEGDFDVAFFTPTEMAPITHWLSGDNRRIGFAVDPDGLIAVVVQGEPGHDTDADMGDANDVRDNIALITSHLLRRALGDSVSAEASHTGDNAVYIVGPTEMPPVPIDYTPEPTSEPEIPAMKGRKTPEAQKIAQAVLMVDALAQHPLRRDYAERVPLAPRLAIVALAERGIMRRNDLIAAVENLKRQELEAPSILPVHKYLLASILGLAGVFFGSAFSTTIKFWFSQIIDAMQWLKTVHEWLAETASAFNKIAPTALLEQFFFGFSAVVPVVIFAALATLSVYRIVTYKSQPRGDRRRRIQEKFGTLTRWSLLLLGTSLMTALMIMRASGAYGGVLSTAEIATLSFVLFFVSLLIFAWCFRYEDQIERLIGLETSNARNDGLMSLDLEEAESYGNRLEWYLLAVPVLFMIFAVVLSQTELISKEWLSTNPSPRPNGSAARYDAILVALAWALPVISFGTLITAWNRFGESGFLTLTHDIVLRRLKQVESVIRNDQPLVELLQQRFAQVAQDKAAQADQKQEIGDRMPSDLRPAEGSPGFQVPRFIDMEKAANAMAPEVELIKAMQQGARNSFVRRSALLATTVLALLQIDAFKTFKPSSESDLHRKSVTQVLEAALFKALDPTTTKSSDWQSENSKAQAALVSDHLREFIARSVEQHERSRAPHLFHEASLCALDNLGSETFSCGTSEIGPVIEAQTRGGSIPQEDTTTTTMARIIAGMLQHSPAPPSSGDDDMAPELPTLTPEALTRAIADRLTRGATINTEALSLETLPQILATTLADNTVMPPKVDLDEIKALIANLLAERTQMPENVALDGIQEKLAGLLAGQVKVPDTLGSEELRKALATLLVERIKTPEGGVVSPMPGMASSNAPLFPSIPKGCNQPDSLIARIHYRSGESEFSKDGVTCIHSPVDSRTGQLVQCAKSGYGDDPAYAFADTEKEMDSLRAMIRARLEDPEQTPSYLLVAGFADLRGNPMGNMQISQRRANIMKQKLRTDPSIKYEQTLLPVAAIGRGEEANASYLSPTVYRDDRWSRRVEIRVCY